MAPAQVSSQQLIAQAAQTLSTAMGTTGDSPTEFAQVLLGLLEVSAKINQFDELNALATDEASSEEAKKWRDISMMTTQFMLAQLSEQQQRLIARLQDLSQSGASLVKEPAVKVAMEEPAIEVAMKPVPKAAKSSAPPVKPEPMAVKPPPGLPVAPPPGLSAPAKKAAPPPGLVSAGSGRGGAAGPDDVEYTSVKKQAPWNIKKQASANVKKEAEDGWTVKKGTQWKATSKKPSAPVAPAPAATSVFLNFDAYDSD